MPPDMPRLLWIMVILVLLTPVSGCHDRRRQTSVLLVTIDTLRADHLGCYGYERPTSATIDRLASEGVLFEHVYASVPRTTQSVASILTGRYPSGHGARALVSFLSPANLTLSEILKEEGYATGAFVSNMFLGAGQGFGQGFDRFDNPIVRWEGNSAPDVTAAALEWLDAVDPQAPFFLWVHYLDPHWRYSPSPPFDGIFGAGGEDVAALHDRVHSAHRTKGNLIFRNRLNRDTVDRLVALYDGEIAQVDAALAPLMERVRSMERSVLTVLTSDHGESLGEHEYFFAHGEYLYQPGLHIPLIIHHPGHVRAGTRSVALGQNIDIAPTILGLLGVDRLQSVDGRPLLMRGEGRSSDGGILFVPSPGRRIVFAETDFRLIHEENGRFLIPGPLGRWSSVSDGRYKLIHIPVPGGEMLEFYDLEKDPGEIDNLESTGVVREERARLLRELKGWVDYDPGTGLRDTTEFDREDLERLRSLGYIN